MEKLDSRPDKEFDWIFRRLDIIVENIHRYAVEPLFSTDIRRRSADLPTSIFSDEYIMKRMILLIAFSERVQSSSSGDIHDKFCQGENGDFP